MSHDDEILGSLRALTGEVGELKGAINGFAGTVGECMATATQAQQGLGYLAERVAIVECTCRERACAAARVWKVLALVTTIAAAGGTIYGATAPHTRGAVVQPGAR